MVSWGGWWPGILAVAAVLWLSGLRLFLHSKLAPPHKVAWASFLVLIGVAIGLCLSADGIGWRFLVVLAALPLLALADVLLLRSGRGLSFWIRACGFEVCTVFGAAGLTRWLCDRAGVVAWLSGVR